MKSTKIGVCAVRITRALENGTPVFSSPTGALLIRPGNMSLALTPNIQTGAEQFIPDSCGIPVVSDKEDDVVKRWDWVLTTVVSDYRLEEIMGLAVLVEDAGDPVGSLFNLAAGCEVPETPPRFIMEAWTKQRDCAAAAASPYQRLVLPYNRAVPTGETYAREPTQPTFSGFSLANPNFGDGPFGDLDLAAGETDWGYAKFDDDEVPAAVDPFDYVETPPAAS